MRKPRTLILLGVLSSIAFVLMATVQVPLLPTAPYLRYDPSDAVGLMAAFLVSPAAGLVVVALKDLLYLLFRARSIFGPLGNFIAVGTFVGVAGWTYHRRQARSLASIVAACAVGALARILVMVPANFLLLNLQFGLAPQKVAQLLWPVIIPFNGIASVVNAGLGFVIMAAIKRRGLVMVHPATPD